MQEVRAMVAQHLPQFRLTPRAALALAISSAFAGNAWSQVAQVNFASTGVTATGPDGTARTLGRGAQINVGDTVSTSEGRAQLRFVDGAFVSLQPGTQFKIDEFNYSGQADGTEKGFFSLLRGAMRTVTGAVGRTNRDAYRVTTSTATIGIRGTEFLADVSNSLTLFVGGGTVSLVNAAGTFIVQAGQSAFVQNQNSAPQIVFEKPVLPPPAAQQGTTPPPAAKQGFASTELTIQLPGFTQPVVLPPATTTVLQGTGVFSIDGVAELVPSSGIATLDAAKNATLFVNTQTAESFSIGSASTSEGFFDGIIGVGRWTNGTATALIDQGGGPAPVSATLGANQGLHYVIGTPTPALPTSIVATYSLLAATKATSQDGSLGLGTFAPGGGPNTPVMSVDFMSGGVGLDFSVTFPTAGYRATTFGGIGDPTQSQVRLLGGAFGNVAAVPVTGVAGAACAGGEGGCVADVLGFFAGTNASRAGFGYKIFDSSIPTVISGTAALAQKTPETVSLAIAFAEGDVFEAGLPPGSAVLASTTAATDQTRKLHGFADPASYTLRGTHNFADVGVDQMSQNPAIPVAGNDGIIAWNRWMNGFTFGAGARGGTFGGEFGGPTGRRGLAYVMGTPTPASDMAALQAGNVVATYNIIGATRPMEFDGSAPAGNMVTNGGTFTANFGTGQASLTNFRFFASGQNYRIDTPAMPISGSTFGTTGATTSQIGGCGGEPASTRVEGFFAGANAARAGIVYKTHLGQTGAAAYSR
jgi:hypothetical protein